MHKSNPAKLKANQIFLEKETIPQEAWEATGVLQNLFRDRLEGVYLYGSAVLGGLQPESDVDILALLHGEMTESDRKKLGSRLLEISGRVGGPGRPLEVTVACLEDISPWRFPPICRFQYGEWLRADFEAERIQPPFPSPDMTVLIRQASGASCALSGPEASTLLPTVPDTDIRRAILLSIPELTGNIRGDERNALLTFARMWYTAATGEITSKDKAAQWVLSRLSKERTVPASFASLLETARKAYLGECTDSWENLGSETEALASYMSQAVESLLKEEIRQP